MIKLLILITLIFPFIYKYSFVITNQYTQIPIILAYMDKNYLAFDWYVNISREFGPRTIFALYSAFWGNLIGLPATYYFHYVLTIGLTLYSSYRLALILFKNRKAALLSGITILFGSTYSIGGNLLVTKDFTVTQLSLSLSLLAIVLLLEKKHLLSAVLFATAAYFHPLIGTESAFISYTSLFLIFVTKRTKYNFPDISSLVKWGIVPFLLMIIPLFVLYIKEGQSDIAGALKIQIIAFDRTPHHYLPLSFSISDYLSFLSFMFFGFFLILKNKFRANTDLKLFIIYFLIFSFSLMILSTISAYILSFYPGVAIQPFRLSIYLYWFMSVFIYTYFYKSLFSINVSPITSFFPLFLSDYSRLLDYGKVNTLAIILGMFIILVIRKLPYKILLTVLLIYFSLFKYHEKFNYSSYAQFPSPESELADWVKNNTADNDIFLIPPEFEKFRLISERAIVADWKAFPFQESAYLEWFKRMCDIGNQIKCIPGKTNQQKILRGYRSHSAESLIKLSEKYEAKYAVSDVDYPQLPKVYSNYYQIYKLK